MENSDSVGSSPVDGVEAVVEVRESSAVKAPPGWVSTVKGLVWPSDTVDAVNGRARLVSMDVLRGLAIWAMVVLHSVGGTADFEYFLGMKSIGDIVFIVLFSPLFLAAAMRGVFAAVSGVVAGYLMQHRLAPLLSRPSLSQFKKAWAMGIVHALVMFLVFLVLHGINATVNFGFYDYVADGVVPFDKKWYQYVLVQTGPLLYFAQAMLLQAIVLPGVYLLTHRTIPAMAKGSAYRKAVYVTLALVVLSLPFSTLLSPVRSALAGARGLTVREYQKLPSTRCDTLGVWLSNTFYIGVAGVYFAIFPHMSFQFLGAGVGVFMAAVKQAEVKVSAKGRKSVLRMCTVIAVINLVVGIAYFILVDQSVIGFMLDPDGGLDPACNFSSPGQNFFYTGLTFFAVRWAISHYECVTEDVAAKRAQRALYWRRLSAISCTAFCVEKLISGPSAWLLRWMDGTIMQWGNTESASAILAWFLSTQATLFAFTVVSEAIDYCLTADWVLAVASAFSVGAPPPHKFAAHVTCLRPITALCVCEDVEEAMPVQAVPEEEPSV
ncbi:hypothetical protein KIPB_001919 [Kipferlia bialata]|uniref:Uncharacterized protein n=1 Tax=Kipferlia bialata TaxID=797122 RepID=A0A9K3GGA3_9EUKA|nr:hypothetical protein KIPB_001919 [Kipferlia bialata]|eukprot:g1919.t1